VFWTFDAAPAIVVKLAPAGSDRPAAPDPTCIALDRRRAGDGLHLRLAGGLQVLVPSGLGPQAAIAALLPLDDRFEARAVAAARLYALLAGSAGPRMGPISRDRRLRLRRMLRALDARAQGASYREIAEHVLGARFTDSLAWRTSPARDAAIRLWRSGLNYARGGYLALLRRR
jgi:hypothetical protein